MTVRDSEFRGNVSSWNGSGAAAYCCDVSNCVFTANYTSGQNSTACFHGGGDKFAVYDSTFLCNTNASTSGQGGIVCSAKNAIGCVFVGNTALQSYIVLGCSGVDNVIDCAFTNNTNVSSGYALLAGCTNVIGSTVYGCSGLSYAIVSPTLVSNCTFVANLAGQSPVYGAQETTEIHDSAFLFNTNTANAANASAVKSAKLVARSVFVGNSGSHMYSGAIHGAGRVVDCAFTNNFISASGRGSSGYQCGSFENCSFSGEIGGCGSALYEPDVVSNCTFVACETHERDGGAAIYGKATTCVYDCLIVDCTNVTSSANALAVNNVMRMERCAITGCYSQFGYLIRNFDALVNCAITNNPSIWAAWLYGRDGSSLTNCLIAGNSASNSYTYHGIQNIANLVNCTIVSNTIPGHLVVDSSNSTIWNSIFADNQPYDVSGNALSNSFYVTANAAPDANEGCRQLASIAEVCFSGDPAMPYSLKGRSPARGAGLLLEGLAGTKDLLGHPRIGLDGVDLGCCAYYSRRGFTMVLR